MVVVVVGLGGHEYDEAADEEEQRLDALAGLSPTLSTGDASAPLKVGPQVMHEIDSYRSEWLGEKIWRQRVTPQERLTPTARMRANRELQRALADF
jgi:hypothetical protein